ncbi:MAG: hypothetical protein H0U15_12995 [Geodermatophilaceae bacterium]|nr:hypothetical protein [Geodermatophilaceae bacterium]
MSAGDGSGVWARMLAVVAGARMLAVVAENARAEGLRLRSRPPQSRSPMRPVNRGFAHRMPRHAAALPGASVHQVGKAHCDRPQVRI